MRRYGTLLMTWLCACSFAANSFASDSIYYRGDWFAGIGYTSSTVALPATVQNITDSGMNIQLGYFFTPNIDIEISYVPGNFAQGSSISPGNTTICMIGYHQAFVPRIGGYIGLGYTSFSIGNPIGVAGISGSGFTYEIGVEKYLKENPEGYLREHVIVGAFYRGASPTLTQGGASFSTTESTFGIKVNYLFF